MSNPALVLNVQATNIVQAYQDDCSETCEMLCPIKMIDAPLFSCDTWNPDEHFDMTPDFDLVGRQSIPNVRDYSLGQNVYRVLDYALLGRVPESDASDARSKNKEIDLKNHVSEATVRDLHRYSLIRTVKIYSDPTSYAPGNVVSVPAGEKLTFRPTGGAAFPDIVGKYLGYKDQMLIKPNIMAFLNKPVYTACRTNPAIVEAVKGTGAGITGASGAVSKQELAELFEVDRVVVVDHKQNAAPLKDGERVGKVHIGTPDIVFALIDPLSDMQVSVPSFAMKAVYAPLRSYDIFDPMPGVEGRTNVKVGWRIREIVKAPDAGFLIRGAI